MASVESESKAVARWQGNAGIDLFDQRAGGIKMQCRETISGFQGGVAYGHQMLKVGSLGFQGFFA